MLSQLVALQAIDLEIDQIDEAIHREQNGLDERVAALAAREASINKLEEMTHAQKAECRTLEYEMEDKKAHVRERQAKMMQIQTGREQTALLKEIEEAKNLVKENEEKIVSIMESIETLSNQMKEEKNLFKGEKKLVAEETSKVQKSIDKINKGKKQKNTARNKQAKGIQDSLLQKYDTLRQRRNGLAVVNVLDGVCQGCFMAIPPQRYNMLLKGDQIFDCPTCQRLIYHQSPQ